jgi:hypothetical protein
MAVAACVMDEEGAAATLKGGELDVMHGELFGIVMALVRAWWEMKRSVTILTDYWNGIRKLRRIIEGGKTAATFVFIIFQKSFSLSAKLVGRA